MQRIEPCKIFGTITAPTSKSMMQRAIAIASLTQGKSVLHGDTASDDSKAALQVIYDLGSEVRKKGNSIYINGAYKPRTNKLNCGESGLGIRMFTPIAALHSSPLTLHGHGSLKTRPISMIEAPLRDLGVQIQSNNGLIPIQVCGPLVGGTTHVDGSISSQVLTGLLIASPCAQQDTYLHTKDLKSKPYIDMTIQIMEDFGVSVTHSNYEQFFVKAHQTYVPQEYTVEGDWSGASFFVVAAALGGQVTIHNVRSNSKQADIAIIEAVTRAGARVQIDEHQVTVNKHTLKAFEFDATECPDLFPPLVALAAHCTGVSKITGVSRLTHKESNRALVLQTEFAKLGTRIENIGDTMFIYGGTLQGGRIHAHNDHRIAMAGACAAIRSQQAIEIENPECVAKSYPHFFEDFKSVCGY